MIITYVHVLKCIYVIHVYITYQIGDIRKRRLALYIFLIIKKIINHLPNNVFCKVDGIHFFNYEKNIHV